MPEMQFVPERISLSHPVPSSQKYYFLPVGILVVISVVSRTTGCNLPQRDPALPLGLPSFTQFSLRYTFPG